MAASPVALLLALAAGACFGAIFFGGLAWTTGRIARQGSLNPFVFASFLVRLGICAAGFYAVLTLAGAGGLMSALGGFAIVQLVFVSRSGRKAG
jgi:F1F0 ATPase subunit 2